ncbi:MAG: C1 family peptidase [Alphaproteobacteria bacterium]|nr:C1 family peptidase [Alphaproteobacteria bacterium]
MAAKRIRSTAPTVSERVQDKPSERVIGGRLMDARRDRLDLRDRAYQPRVRSLLDEFPKREHLGFLRHYIDADLILDQGLEGACTGFGLACVVNYLLWRKEYEASGWDPKKPPAGFKKVSPRMLYHLARLYDEWPGEDYDGSSCRGALKGWHKHGVCEEALWRYAAGKFVEPTRGWAEDAMRRTLGVYYRIDKNSVVDVQAAIQEVGAVYVSSDVHPGWSKVPTVDGVPTFDRLPKIPPGGGEKPNGGHAYALVGFNQDGFIIQNSWGRRWGLGGFALLSYDDWRDYGFDAWAVALGVPKPVPPVEAKRRSRKQAELGSPRVIQPVAVERDLRRTLGVTIGRAKPGQRDDRLSERDAYERTLVLGNNGAVDQKLVEHENAQMTVQRIGADIPGNFLDKTYGKAGKAKLLVYAHGGLNSEAASIARIRALGWLFEQNGIYPLFISWRTGAMETISNIGSEVLEDLVQSARGPRDLISDVGDAIVEAKDRTLEVATQAIGRALWDEMKENAALAGEPGGGTYRLVGALKELSRRRNGGLEIHLVGHSAGAILLGHMLEWFGKAQFDGDDGRLKVASCTLYAPACTVAFANERYVPRVKDGTIAANRLRIHVLSDRLERDDKVGPYGKSLLYLVSRAFERWHKTPILGMQCAFDDRFNPSRETTQWGDPGSQPIDPLGRRGESFEVQLKSWQAFWRNLPGLPADRLIVEEKAEVSQGSDGDAGTIKAAHGCFDNHAGVINGTIASILGKANPAVPAGNLNY